MCDYIDRLFNKGRQISAATLQHFFIMYRKRSAEDAIKDVAKKIEAVSAVSLNDKTYYRMILLYL